MRLALIPHPDSVCDSVQRIEVDVSRPAPGLLALEYVVTGTLADLLIPPPAAPSRADNLWQHTCFEVFIRSPDSQAYREFNFAPSREWAAYRFDDYRSGMAPDDVGAPRIATHSVAGRFHLSAQISRIAPVPLQLALSAVIEEANGRKSYWALAHPAGKADFHHPSSFAHEIS